VRCEFEGFEQLAPHLQKAIRNFVFEVALSCQILMRQYAPGRIKDTISQRTIDDLNVVVNVGAPHAVFVELGTRPHMIRAVVAKALRFKVGGRVVFAKSVRHPGTKPQFFMRRAAEETEKRIPRLWVDSWRSVT